MARPRKKSIDYFPLDCILNDSVKYIEAKHGLTGFAVLVKLWSKIYASEGYYCNWNDKVKYLFCKEHNIEVELIDKILETCFLEKILNPDIFQEYAILTSEGIQKRYFKIIKESRRTNTEIEPDFYLLGVNSVKTGVNVGVNDNKNGITPVETPQRKVKETKVNKSKGEKGENPPDESLKESDLDDTEETKPIDQEEETQSKEKKEKSSAKKEKENWQQINESCKAFFLTQSKQYYWETKDDKHVNELLKKLKEVEPNQSVKENFELFIRYLPKYWKTKKFTIPHLNQNYNEIINEIYSQNNGAKFTDNKTEYFGRHDITELSDRANSFGREN